MTPLVLNKGATTGQKLGESESGEARIEGKARERAGVWGGSGRELGEPLPRNFLEFQTPNRSIW